MALRYPTQPLRMTASTATLSILHFVDPEEDSTPRSLHALVRSFANFRPRMAYTIIKEFKQYQQTKYTLVTLFSARALCNLLMSMEYHPVEWLHTPINPETGTMLEFASWNEEVTLKTLSTVI